MPKLMVGNACAAQNNCGDFWQLWQFWQSYLIEILK